MNNLCKEAFAHDNHNRVEHPGKLHLHGEDHLPVCQKDLEKLKDAILTKVRYRDQDYEEPKEFLAYEKRNMTTENGNAKEKSELLRSSTRVLSKVKAEVFENNSYMYWWDRLMRLHKEAKLHSLEFRKPTPQDPRRRLLALHERFKRVCHFQACNEV